MPRTTVLQVDAVAPDQAVLEHAGKVIRAGGLVAFATETVYGLGVDATNVQAVLALFVAKGRPPSNPLIVHVADVSMARLYARRWPDAAATLCALWPGPLTLVVPRAPSLPPEVSAGLDTVGLRVPASAVALGLIRAADRPIAAPSANRSEYVSPTRAEHVLADLDGRIDLVLDSGPTSVGIESTVVDTEGAAPRVLRPGPIGASELASVLGSAVDEPHASSGAARSPGQHLRHYAPRCPALRVDSLQELAQLGPTANDVVLLFGVAGSAGTGIVLADPETAARRLYATLRECDALAPDRILVVLPPNAPQWQAVRDRLRRATTTAERSS